MSTILRVVPRIATFFLTAAYVRLNKWTLRLPAFASKKCIHRY